MYKVYFAVVALAIAGAANALQNVVPESNAAPEPYAYAYDTETHAAAEQRDPNGQVTGYYTLTDADGRQRRVEYVADEGGFRAKVQTNELGTKSANSADVEVLAAPPTEGQLVYQAPAVPQVQRQQVVQVQQPKLVQTQQLVQQPLVANNYRGYYQPGYTQYGSYGLNGLNGYGYGNGLAYNRAYGYGNGLYGQGVYGQGLYGGYSGYSGYGAGYGNGLYSNYNLHTPQSYYRAFGNQQVAPLASYSNGASLVSGSRYVTSGAVPAPAGIGASSSYQTIGQPVSTVSSGSLSGSSNYIVLKKKRESGEKKAE